MSRATGNDTNEQSEKVQNNSTINGVITTANSSRSSTPWWPRYPSWLPRRPSPPQPHSSRAASVTPALTEDDILERDASEGPSSQGRRATPRSVRILSQPLREEKQQQSTRPVQTPNPPRFSLSRAQQQQQQQQPRFRLPGLRLENLRSPSITARIRFFLLPVYVFAHLVLQTFLDINALFILIQVTKFPAPSSIGPSSGRTWTLAVAAYIFCYVVQIFGIFLLYEVVYSFYRRWRTKRPLIIPLYLSSAAHNLVSITSYSNFCFFRYIRRSALLGDGDPEQRVWTDAIAEQCYFYAQNLPTVLSLLPRAALCLALLFTFSISGGGVPTGVAQRDTLFFTAADSTLTAYAKGVLIANAVWTAWRMVIVMVSFVGLWILSGKGCAGMCGPRFRWDEPEDRTERAQSVYIDSEADLEQQRQVYDPLGWEWRERTLGRIHHAWRFCLTYRGRITQGEKEKQEHQSPDTPTSAFPLNVLDDVLESAGFPTPPMPVRRRDAISSAFFEAPATPTPPATPSRATAAGGGGLSDIIPPSSVEKGKARDAPLMQLPYPFTGFGGRPASPTGSVPFPSPMTADFPKDITVEPGTPEDVGGGSGQRGESGSGSMSSLGQPLSSRSSSANQYQKSAASGEEQDQSFLTESQSQSGSSGVLEPRRRAESVPSGSATTSVRHRTRTISGISHGHGSLEPSPEPEPESFLESDNEEDAAEREDSVGLLSPRVSHQSSLAGLRRRSLSHSARLSGGGGGSNNGSGSGGSRSSGSPTSAHNRSFSGSAHNRSLSSGSPVSIRSRAQSLVQAVIRSRSNSEESNGGGKSEVPQGRSSEDTNGTTSGGSSNAQAGGHTFGRPLPWYKPGGAEPSSPQEAEEGPASLPHPPPQQEESPPSPQGDDTFGRPLPLPLSLETVAEGPPSPPIPVPTRERDEQQQREQDIATAPASLVTEFSVMSDQTTTVGGHSDARSHFTLADLHPDPTQYRSV